MYRESQGAERIEQGAPKELGLLCRGSYLVLAAGLRRGEEEAKVRQIIHKAFKRDVKLTFQESS